MTDLAYKFMVSVSDLLACASIKSLFISDTFLDEATYRLSDTFLRDATGSKKKNSAIPHLLSFSYQIKLKNVIF